MKSRLAKKIANVPINRISDYWFNQCRGAKDARIMRAINMMTKLKEKERYVGKRTEN